MRIAVADPIIRVGAASGGQSQDRSRQQDKRADGLPRTRQQRGHACQRTAHAGRAPMPRSTRRPTIPTSVTSSAATTDPATSAAHISIVWL